MRQISDITQCKLKELLNYCPHTGVFTWIKKVNSKTYVGLVAERKDKEGYAMVMVLGKNYRQHRLAWFYMTGQWPKKHLDHKNGVRDDNRFCNLRECDEQDNNRNRGLSIVNTSGVSGVSFQQGKWCVRVRLNKHVRRFFGYYDDIELAELVANSVRDKYHKEFSLCAR